MRHALGTVAPMWSMVSACARPHHGARSPLDSDLGQLSRRDHGLCDYLWIAADWAEMERVFTGNVQHAVRGF